MVPSSTNSTASWQTREITVLAQYNKKHTEQLLLEQGVTDNLTMHIEGLYDYINELIAAVKEVQADVELQDYIDEWEG